MTRITKRRSKLPVLMALSGLFVLGTVATSADAQPRRVEHHEFHHEWRHDGHGRAYYPAPPVVYGSPYYAPPPVVYGPGIGINLPGVSINIQ